MTKLFSNYKRAAIDFASAQGNYLTDTTGKTYLDFSSGIGVTNLGYHPRFNQANRSGRQDFAPAKPLLQSVARRCCRSFNW